MVSAVLHHLQLSGLLSLNSLEPTATLPLLLMSPTLGQTPGSGVVQVYRFPSSTSKLSHHFKASARLEPFLQDSPNLLNPSWASVLSPFVYPGEEMKVEADPFRGHKRGGSPTGGICFSDVL